MASFFRVKRSIVAVAAVVGILVLGGLNRPLHAADAMQGSSFYVSGFGGITLLSESDFSQPGIGSGSFDYDAGFNIGGAVGYRWPFSLRTEVELSYRQNSIDTATVTIAGIGTISGSVSDSDVSAFAFMANAWYDIDTGSNFIPYIGGGLGGARIDVDLAGTEFDDTVFAWQIGAGLGYKVTPGVVVSVDYRWLATTDPAFEDPGFPDVDSEYSSHNIMLGVRGHF